MSAKKEETWFTGSRMHEGYPLYLRFPEERNHEALSKKFPILTVIEHKLSSVKSNGLPTTEYNESLDDLDESITKGMDCIVLIETFGGRRTYYGYFEDEEKAVIFYDGVVASFPDERFELETKKDSNWKFIRRYSEDYEFYRKNG